MHEVYGDVYVVCINLNLYRYIFQRMIYELVKARMIDTAGSYLAQMEK